MQTLSFPMRLQPSGLLRRQDETSSVLELLQVMARTPAGSWTGCASFGLRDLFEQSRLRADVTRTAQARINEAFQDLGIDQFEVIEVSRELSAQRETDTYAITLRQRGGTAETVTTAVTYEP